MAKQPKKAGGLPSLKSTLKSVLQSQQPRTNLKNLRKANQAAGFDCPGCAWGDQKEGLLQFCENGAKAIAWESTKKTIGAAFFQQHTVAELQQQSDHWLEFQGRIAEPLSYNPETDKYEAVSWNQAFTEIANTVNALSSPDELELYTSGRASNEAAFMYQLFGRLFGTNNFPDCSNMCHEASGVALTQSIGIGKGTVVLSDFDKADAIFVFGQNPGSNHPRMMNALRSAARGGCRIVTFNNLKEVALKRFASPQDPIELLTPAATEISHHYFSPKLGGDMAVVRGMVKAIVESGKAIDRAFIDEHTVGFDAYLLAVDATSWEQIEEQSGLSEQKIRTAAEVYQQADRVICTWAMGITQHKHSVAMIREIVNLQLLGGHIGKAGAGLCPVRGHSNVQGNRTVGINEKPKAAFLQALSQRFNRSMPMQPGHNVYHAIRALLEGKSKVLVCLGGNIAAAAPDSRLTEKALRNTQLNVQISTKLNRSHLMVGQRALILPCLGRTEIDRQRAGEQAITVEDTFSMVHASQGNVEPASQHLKSEVAIVCGMAHATLGVADIDWLAMQNDYDRIREHIAAVLPAFGDVNHKIQQPGGFYLGNSAANFEWLTESGKAEFSALSLPDSLLPIELGQLANERKQTLFTLQSLRSHDQYNTTIYGMDDRYRGIVGERQVLFIHAKDAKREGFSEGETVTITSVWKDNELRQVSGFKLVFYDIPRGNLAAYYPETNPLVPLDSVGDGSFTPTSKAVGVILSRES